MTKIVSVRVRFLMTVYERYVQELEDKVLKTGIVSLTAAEQVALAPDRGLAKYVGNGGADGTLRGKAFHVAKTSGPTATFLGILALITERLMSRF